MPSTPKPKQFVAARSFIHRGRVYRSGDPITDRRTIAWAVTRGDRFIVRKPSKTAPAESPADPDVVTAATPTAESIKED